MSEEVNVDQSNSDNMSMLQKMRQRWRSTLFLGAGIMFLGFGAIQLIPIDRTNPPTTCEIQWDSAETRALAVDACYDCHSNETNWTWYSKIALVSWQVANHVVEGREYLNFSEWDLQRNPERLTEEFAEVILDDEMPTWDYRLIHSEAKLTDDEKQQLIDGFSQTVAKNGNSCAE